MDAQNWRRFLATMRAEPKQATSPAVWAELPFSPLIIERHVARLSLYGLPQTHRNGPIRLNFRRTFDRLQALAMVSETAKVIVYDAEQSAWHYTERVALLVKRMGWKGHLQFRGPLPERVP